MIGGIGGLAGAPIVLPLRSPSGKKFRSKPQLARYLGGSMDLSTFDFRTGKMLMSKMNKSRQRVRYDSSNQVKVSGGVMRVTSVQGVLGGDAAMTLAAGDGAQRLELRRSERTEDTRLQSRRRKAQSAARMARTRPATGALEELAGPSLRERPPRSVGVLGDGRGARKAGGRPGPTSLEALSRRGDPRPGCSAFLPQGKPDLNTALPVRQTASIFKQPVTKITNHPSNKVKSDPQKAVDQPRQVSQRTATTAFPASLSALLFWEKKLSGLNAFDIAEELVKTMDLPKGLQGVGPGCTDETLLSAIASALHTSTMPITGQLSAAVEKNPGVWLNTTQPLCKAFMVTDEDIR
ncbi:hypothetical protein P7K49_032791 [Saguinus oedipus]|uniref:MBD domain-containing protein n=4 Tax=Simiiformes TaxID=314293 RepID=A0ABQ9TQ25_SAGOE|nr:hypothetical protein P7K49_032791 [Saguinus oedipus]